MVSNIGKFDDHPTVQALLADHKCINCLPPVVPELPPDFTIIERRISAHEVGRVAARGLLYGVGDNAPNVFYGLLHGGTKPEYLDGVEPLSDTSAPDPFIGRRT